MCLSTRPPWRGWFVDNMNATTFSYYFLHHKVFSFEKDEMPYGTYGLCYSFGKTDYNSYLNYYYFVVLKLFVFVKNSIPEKNIVLPITRAVPRGSMGSLYFHHELVNWHNDITQWHFANKKNCNFLVRNNYLQLNTTEENIFLKMFSFNFFFYQ